ncbi:MAG: D-hexose-6-phosphate mutarotase [Gemmatimonadaceae bacterium]
MRTPSRPARQSGGVRDGVGGMPMATLESADGASADIYLHGAHVTSWRPAPDGEERLFLSARSEFNDRAAIRGGIPVIFPQFATEGPLPRHGFARTSLWSLDSLEQRDEGDAVATFTLTDSPATHATWAAEFGLTLTVRVAGARLEVMLGVENTGSSPFSFAAALHTYLRVRDAERAEVVGLHGARYRESSAPTLLHIDDDRVVRAAGPVDRVYVNAPRSVMLREPERSLNVEMMDFTDMVLWNPGAEAARRLADMEPHGEREMMCIEAAVVQRPIALASGGRWSGRQTLDAAPLTLPPGEGLAR